MIPTSRAATVKLGALEGTLAVNVDGNGGTSYLLSLDASGATSDRPVADALRAMGVLLLKPIAISVRDPERLPNAAAAAISAIGEDRKGGRLSLGEMLAISQRVTALLVILRGRLGV